MKKLISTLAAVSLLTMSATANAAILFQDDDFHDILSEGLLIDSDYSGGDVDVTLQMGNDGTDGTIIWDNGLSEFLINSTVDVTGNLDISGDVEADGNVNFSAADSMRIREVDFGGVFTGVGNAPACTTDGELAVDIGPASEQLYLCTDTATDTWTAVSGNADLLDGLDSTQFLRSDTSDTYQGGTLTIDGTGTVDASAGTLVIPTGVGLPGTPCTPGSIYFDQTSDQLYSCNAAGSAWIGPDFEDIYANDDGTFDTSGGSITYDLGGTGNLNYTNVNNIDFNAATFDVLTTGDITFQDDDMTSPVSLSTGDDGLDVTFGAIGILDAINQFVSTANGEGASLVGVEDTGANLENIDPVGTVTDLQDALESIDSEIGDLNTALSAENDVLVFDPEYPDTVVYQNNGANSRGRLDALYDTTDGNYYRWTTNRNNPQQIQLRFSFPVPSDYSTASTFEYEYMTAVAGTTDNWVQVQLLDDIGGTSCGDSGQLASVTGGVWVNNGSTAVGACTLTAGEIAEFVVTLMADDNPNDGEANIGQLKLNYSN